MEIIGRFSTGAGDAGTRAQDMGRIEIKVLGTDGKVSYVKVRNVPNGPFLIKSPSTHLVHAALVIEDSIPNDNSNIDLRARFRNFGQIGD